MRLIAVGDFGQLLPVARFGQKRDWCFLEFSLDKTGFITCELKHNQRVQETHFLDILHDVRQGKVTPQVQDFLNEHTKNLMTRIIRGPDCFRGRDQSEMYNQKKLNEIREDEHVIDSIYLGDEKFIANLSNKICC